MMDIILDECQDHFLEWCNQTRSVYKANSRIRDSQQRITCVQIEEGFEWAHKAPRV